MAHLGGQVTLGHVSRSTELLSALGVGRICGVGLVAIPPSCRAAVLCPEQRECYLSRKVQVSRLIPSVFDFSLYGASFEMLVMEQSVQGGHSCLRATCMVSCFILYA